MSYDAIEYNTPDYVPDDAPNDVPDDDTSDPFTTPPVGYGNPIADMTERQLLEEIVFQQRSIMAALVEFKNMKPAEMVKNLFGRK